MPFRKKDSQEQYVDILLKTSKKIMQVKRKSDPIENGEFIYAVSVSSILLGVASLFDDETPEDYKKWLIDILVKNDEVFTKIMNAKIALMAKELGF